MRASTAGRPKMQVLDDESESVDGSAAAEPESGSGRRSKADAAAEDDATAAEDATAVAKGADGETKEADATSAESDSSEAEEVSEKPARPGFFSRFRRPFGHLTEPEAEPEP